MQDIQRRDEGHYETLQQVVDLFVTGNKNATAIAKLLGLPRRDVLDYIDEWQGIAKSNEHIKDRAVQALNNLDLHYDKIIREQWIVYNDIATTNQVKATLLKSIADVEAKRQEILQKAGLYDDAGIADQIVEVEEKYDAIETLLLSVIKLYPETKMYIMERLAAFNKDTVVTVPTYETGEVVRN